MLNISAIDLQPYKIGLFKNDASHTHILRHSVYSVSMSRKTIILV